MFKKYQYHIQSNRQIAPGVIQLTLQRNIDTPVFRFRPGQYATISGTANGEKIAERPFSISSSPNDQNHLQFTLKVFGNYTTLVSQLKANDPVTIAGPYGSFIFDERAERELVLIAGGIGITPFISMIRYATEKQLPQLITLIYSSRQYATTPFLDEIQELAEKNPQFRAVIHLTDEKTPLTKPGWYNGRIDATKLSQYCQDVDQYATFFICGPTIFTNVIRADLHELGVAEERIVTEEFALAPATFLPRDRRFTLATASATVLLLIAFFYFINHNAAEAQSAASAGQYVPVVTTVPSTSTAAPTSISTPSTSSTTSTGASTMSPAMTTPTPTPQPTVQYQYVPQPRTRMS